jgi:catechol 2,3-dioxygenase-like lactoylglutathione lyase family enzyme
VDARRQEAGGDTVSQVSVRYIVNDVDAAIAFYTEMLGVEVVMHPAPPFAMLKRDDLRLLLNQPGGGGGGGQATGAGAPSPGGWNRFQIEVDDVDAMFATLKAKGATFRSDVITGTGGKQVILDDPSGNPVELFQSF